MSRLEAGKHSFRCLSRGFLLDGPFPGGISPHRRFRPREIPVADDAVYAAVADGRANEYVGGLFTSDVSTLSV